MYQTLAHLYDWHGSLDFADKIYDKTMAILASEQVTPPGPILDIACGTGTLAIQLAKSGWTVEALDISKKMLTLARQKAKEEGISVQWRQEDMRNFTLSSPVAVALCYYDSLNHLLNLNDLEHAFASIAKALKPGGLFLFDLNTLDNYVNFWHGKDTSEGPNHRLTFNTNFDEQHQLATVSIIAEEYTEKGLQVMEEVFHEKFFSEVDVRSRLKAAGFRDIHVKDFNPVDVEPNHLVLKTFWQCRKS